MITTTQMCVKNDSWLLTRFRLFYLVLTSFIVGVPLAVPLYIPLCIIAIIFPPARIAADHLMKQGIAFLLSLQPWLKGSIDIQLPKLAEGQGLLIVSNHRSHLDVFILLSRIPGIRVLAKQTLFWIPLLNVMMWASGQIPVPQGRLDAFFAAMKNVRKRLSQGQYVHIFPELTRCLAGFRGVKNFSTAPFATALDEKIWILPIVFKNTDAFWPKGRSGISAGLIDVRSLPAIDSRLFSSPNQLRDEVQKQIQMALA